MFKKIGKIMATISELKNKFINLFTVDILIGLQFNKV